MNDGVYVDVAAVGDVGFVAAVRIEGGRAVESRTGPGRNERHAILFGKQQFPGHTVYCDERTWAAKLGATYVSRRKNPAHAVCRAALKGVVRKVDQQEFRRFKGSLNLMKGRA